MKAGDTVQMKYAFFPGPIGILLDWWEWPAEEDRKRIIYWKVLIDGKIKDIKERHLIRVE